jgi:hypothetical protein
MKPMRRRIASAIALACPYGTGAWAADRRRTGGEDVRTPAPFSFAFLGDVPYNALEAQAFRRMVDAIDPQCAFAIHIGDLKSGTERCDDTLLEERHALLAGRPDLPILFVPGDNDWTDCERLLAGGYDRWERLGHLRRLFFGASPRGPQGTGPVQRQVDLHSDDSTPENLMWAYRSVVFVTLNRPGGVDVESLPAQEAGRFQALYRANAHWLDDAFARAQRDRAPAVVIAAHANPGFHRDVPGRLPSIRRDVHREFRRLLAEHCREFGRPVLFLHGDTHRFQTNRPLHDAAGQPVPNFTRVESFGSPFGESWVRISYDPAADPVFTVAVRHLESRRAP